MLARRRHLSKLLFVNLQKSNNTLPSNNQTRKVTDFCLLMSLLNLAKLAHSLSFNVRNKT